MRSNNAVVFMKLSDIGEERIVREILGLVFRRKPKLGYAYWGDDANLIKDLNLLLTCDSVSEETDMIPGMSWRDLGWKLAVSSISDIASKGGKPIVALVTLGLRPNMLLDEVKEFYKGLEDACMEYGFEILGGDTSALSKFNASIFMVGYAPDNIPWRNNAKPGDLVCTTGEYGLTGLAYTLIFKLNKKISELRDELKRAILKPKARLEEGMIIAKYANAMIDSSDGLAKSLHEIAYASNKTIIIYEDKIPINKIVLEEAERYNLNPLNLALYGGEEYELIFTVSKDMLKELKRRVKVRVIGEVRKGESKVVMMLKDGRSIQVDVSKSWDPFRQYEWLA